MELFSFLLFIMTGLFFYTRGDKVLYQTFKEWSWRFKVAKTLGFKNILRACYNTITMLCIILIKTTLMKLNKKFNVNTNGVSSSVELCSKEELDCFKEYDKHALYYKLTFYINKTKVCKIISVIDNDIYPIMAIKDGKDITNEIAPYFEKNVQFEKVDLELFFGNNLIVSFSDGSEMRIE